MAQTNGNRVRELRVERLLSQRKLAELAKVSEKTISLIEAGRVEPFQLTQERIARALGVTREEAFPDLEAVS